MPPSARFWDRATQEELANTIVRDGVTSVTLSARTNETSGFQSARESPWGDGKFGGWNIPALPGEVKPDVARAIRFIGEYIEECDAIECFQVKVTLNADGPNEKRVYVCSVIITLGKRLETDVTRREQNPDRATLALSHAFAGTAVEALVKSIGPLAKANETSLETLRDMLADERKELARSRTECEALRKENNDLREKERAEGVSDVLREVLSTPGGIAGMQALIGLAAGAMKGSLDAAGTGMVAGFADSIKQSLAPVG